MAAPVANSVPLTGNPLIDGLVQGSSWQFGGGPQTLTYSLSLNDLQPGGSGPISWATRPDMAAAVAQALAAWSNVANIAFVQQGSGGVFLQSTADMAIALTGTDLQRGLGAISLGIFPDAAYANLLESTAGYSRTVYPHPEGDVFFDNYQLYFNNVQTGSYGFEAIVHEIGHALGLKHPFDDGGNGRPTLEQYGYGSFDNINYTVMSYDEAGRTNPMLQTTYAATPMLFDMLAIQSIYGANMAYHTGNDTYNLASYNNAIWDAGGIDTINAGFSFNATIDLRPGGFSFDSSNPGPMTAIAYGVTIENAVGGAGNDTITGNDADNNIDGGAGIDTMAGGNGNDTYIVDNNADVIIENPGAGTDSVQSSVTFTLPANVENLTLNGFGNLSGAGNALDNVITGDAHDNVLTGGAGNDILMGRGGNDVFFGGTGNDTFVFDTYGASTRGGPTSFQIQGQPGDYISQGQNISFNSTDLNVTATLFENSQGLVDWVRILFQGTVDNVIRTWFFDFNTRFLPGDPAFAPGQYLNAERASSGIPGHPGLDISGDGRGSNQVSGSFTVNAADFDYTNPNSPTITDLSISYVQHSENSAPALTGTLYFNFANAPATTSVPPGIFENANEGIDTVQTSLDGYVLPTNMENLTLTGSANLSGNGNGLDNVLTSNTGVNTLTGGLGNDTYVLNNAGDIVIENPGEGTDTVVAGFSYSLATSNNVENLTLTGSAGLSATGNAADNVLTSNTGVNTLTGGLGNDTYVLSNAADSVVENPGEGTDTVQFAGNFNGTSFLLPTNFENATNVGSVSLTLTGNSLGNTLIGGAGAEIFNGALGNDTLNGNDGFDIATYSGSKASYTITPNLGTFGVNGPDGNDTVSGVEKLTFGDGSVKLLGSVAHASGNDLIGNGFGDVLWRSDSGAVALWALNGATITGGGFVNGGAAAPLGWNVAGVADFNGDGRGDILWRGDDGLVAEWNMNGTAIIGGGFVNGGATVTLAWQIAGVGDFNGDHKSDILWHGSDGVVGLWQMDGPNIIGGGFVNCGALVSTDWSVAGVADFSGDGKADILWRNVDGRIAEWTMNGLTVAGGGFVNGGASVTSDWTIAGVGDFSGDRKADILWQNTDGRVGLWQMDGASLVLGGFANGGTPVTPDWHIAGVGDFSGDGRSDILWRNDDGRIAEWNMNGTTIVGGGFVNNSIPVAPDWIVS